MKRILMWLLCGFLLFLTAGCAVTIAPLETPPASVVTPARSPEPARQPEPTQEPALTPGPEPTQEPEPTQAPEPTPEEGRDGPFLFKTLEIRKAPLWGENVLYVRMTIADDNGMIEDPPLSVEAYQDGSQLAYSLNPDFAPKQPSDPVRAEFIVQLKNTTGDVKLRVNSQAQYEQVLRLDEIEEGDQESIVALIDQYNETARQLHLTTTERYALPDQWPIGMPYYDGMWRIQPFILDTVETHLPYGASIDFNDEYDIDAYSAYIDKCVALGYVASDIKKMLEVDAKDHNHAVYEVTLTGPGYVIKAVYDYYAENTFNWIGFYVRRNRE